MSQRILDYYQTLLGWKIAQSEIGRERAWKMRTFFSAAAAILRGYDMGVGEQWPQAISAANGMGIYCSLGHLQGIYWFCWGCWSRKDAVNLKTTITVHSRFFFFFKKKLFVAINFFQFYYFLCQYLVFNYVSSCHCKCICPSSDWNLIE